MARVERRFIYCCGCKADVSARLTTGDEIYPLRIELAAMRFWKCDECLNYVGCHKSHDCKPLGVIPTPEIRDKRRLIHQVIDPLWKSGFVSRTQLYLVMASRLGLAEYHTANIDSIELANRVLDVAYAISRDIRSKQQIS